MQKEKVVLFVKKEFLFPDFWIFKKLNKLYWWFLLNFFILRVIKKHKKKDLVIISDHFNKAKLEKRGIKSKSFGDYNKKYEERYPDSIKLVKKWFNFPAIKNVLQYREINMGFSIEEDLSWWLIEPIDNVSIVEKILKKEKPEKIILLNKKSIFAECCRATAKKHNIKISFLISFLENLRFIEKIIKKYSLFVRFHRIPFVKRREFVKTGYRNKKKEKKRILFLGLDNEHFGKISSIADEIIKRNKYELVNVCINTETQRQLREKNIDFFSYGDFLDKKTIKKVKNGNKRILDVWKNIKENKEFRKLFLYKGVDLWGIVKEELLYVFSLRFLWIMFYIESAMRLLDETGIDCVVSIGDLGIPTRPTMLAGKSKSIPGLVIQQYVVGNIHGRYVLPIVAENIAVWGQGDKDFMKKFGVEGKRIKIIGTSRLDYLKEKANPKEIYKKYSIKKELGIIILATQHGDDAYSFAEKEKEVLIKSVIEAMDKFPNKQLIIKPHPRESCELHNFVVKESKQKNVRVIKNISIADLIKICDMLITITSTCATEAIILGKPVINLNLFKRSCATKYFESGATLGVFKKKDIVKTIQSIYKNKALRKKLKKNSKKFIRYYCYKNDGKASERIVSLIEKIINKGRKNVTKQQGRFL